MKVQKGLLQLATPIVAKADLPCPSSQGIRQWYQ